MTQGEYSLRSSFRRTKQGLRPPLDDGAGLANFWKQRREVGRPLTRLDYRSARGVNDTIIIPLYNLPDFFGLGTINPRQEDADRSGAHVPPRTTIGEQERRAPGKKILEQPSMKPEIKRVRATKRDLSKYIGSPSVNAKVTAIREGARRRLQNVQAAHPELRKKIENHEPLTSEEIALIIGATRYKDFDDPSW